MYVQVTNASRQLTGVQRNREHHTRQRLNFILIV